MYDWAGTMPGVPHIFCLRKYDGTQMKMSESVEAVEKEVLFVQELVNNHDIIAFSFCNIELQKVLVAWDQ